MPKWLEVIGVIALPLAYGLAVSGLFDWLHRRRAAAASHSAIASQGGTGSKQTASPSDKGGAK